MLNYFIVLFSIFSTFNSAYFPFEKNKHFPDDTCSYQYDKLVTYVKDCEKGKFCKDRGDNFSICENIPTEITLLNADSSEKCETIFECENGLECTNSKCSYPYNCPTGETWTRTKIGYSCKSTTTSKIFYSKDFHWNEDSSASSSNVYHGYINGNTVMNTDFEHFKVGGKITSFNITTTTIDGKIYEPEEIEFSDIGTVEDGDFVFDEKACKSGFALFFYGNNEPVDPSNTHHYMYKKCVTLEDIENNGPDYCTIKYSIKDKTYSYNVNQLDVDAKTLFMQINGNDYFYLNHPSPYPDSYFNSISSYYNIDDICDSDNIIKTKIFQKYIGALTDDVKKCLKKEEKAKGNSKYYLETCQNDQLRKWSYLYENPNYYSLYYKEDDDKGNTVINYLVQKEFPSYQSSSLLNIKYYICLLALLIFL